MATDLYTTKHISDDRRSLAIIAEILSDQDIQEYDEDEFIEECSEEAQDFFRSNNFDVSLIYEKIGESLLEFDEITVIMTKVV
jgi:hypothetical protein